MSWIPNPQRANGLSHYDITLYSNLSSLANVLHARTLPGTEASVYDNSNARKLLRHQQNVLSTSTHIIIRPRYSFRILLQRYSLSVEGPSCCQLLAARPSIILRPSISSDLSHRFQIITPYTPVGDALSTHTYVCPASRKHASGNHGPTFDRAARFGKRSQG
jgi:hypothetical protein